MTSKESELTVRKLSGQIESIVLFVGMASFENRCFTILKAIKEKCHKILIFSNKSCKESADENRNEMLRAAGEKGISEELDLDQPISIAASFQRVIAAIDNSASGNIFVDSTTFTHEQLLILFRILKQIAPKQSVIFGYNGAKQYSFNTTPENIWLSKGVSEIRSVLGFPGRLLPSKRLHLIILVGFEHERAKAVIEQFEPSALSIGVGERGKSVSVGLHDTNQQFFENVRTFVESRKNTYEDIQEFEFSCVNPEDTRDAILEQAKRFPNHNVVICPMNTKLSTIGAALANVENDSLQICYSRAIEYNEAGYSIPSDRVRLFEMSFSNN